MHPLQTGLTELVLPDALDVGEGVLSGRDEPRPPLPHLPIQLVLVVIRPIVSASAGGAGAVARRQLGGHAHHRRIAVLAIQGFLHMRVLQGSGIINGQGRFVGQHKSVYVREVRLEIALAQILCDVNMSKSSCIVFNLQLITNQIIGTNLQFIS